MLVELEMRLFAVADGDSEPRIPVQVKQGKMPRGRGKARRRIEPYPPALLDMK